jgi:hypothetical protein
MISDMMRAMVNARDLMATRKSAQRRLARYMRISYVDMKEAAPPGVVELKTGIKFE